MKKERGMVTKMIGGVALSVVMVTYNHEKYIAEAVESIVSQKTEYKFELLIGNDCSTDSTKEIIRNYQKKYPDTVRVFCSKKNIGATKNGYRLLKHAKGKYVAYCDGDDYWCDTGRIQRDVDFLEINGQYAGVCGRCGIVDENGNALSEDQVEGRLAFWNFAKNVFTLKDFEDWQMPGHISGLTTRNLFYGDDKNLSIFYKAARNVGDRFIVMLAAMDGDIYCIPEKTSCYRFRIAGTNANFMSEYKEKNLKVEDFLMIRRLERWALASRGICIDLGRVKKDRLAGSVVVFMREPTRYNLGVVLRIIHYSGEPGRYLYYSLKVWVLKIYYWHVARTDRIIQL